CATAVSAARRNLTGRRVDVELKGGVLTVEWRADNRIILSGPVSTSFRGETEIPSLRAGVKAA
ncbi:MAG: diaminopimelate epimerase, partial [Sphingomonadales bacterium]|nr:diaminopimelate epimerase [Sphingomonadales bacterium]